MDSRMERMGKMKKIFALALAFIMLFASFSFISASAVEADLDQKTVQFSNETNEQYSKLLEHWNDKLPPYYAGAYIKDMKFYILVTCEPTSVSKEIHDIMNPDVIIKQVKHSYGYLEAINNEVVEKICIMQTEKHAAAVQVIGVGIDEINNRVFVEVLNNGEIDSKAIYAIIGNEDIVDIVLKDSTYIPGVDINAGSKDWVNIGGGSSTIGFCASSINSAGVTELGFIIAGHAGNLYDTVKIGNTTVGTVSSRSYGGQLDTAFVHLDIPSNYVCSKKLSTSYTIDGYGNVGVVGTSYTLRGMTSGIIAGTVDNTSFSFIMDGVSFTNHIRMKMAAAQGDSGGPLVKQNTGYSRSVIGIFSGGDGTYSNFSKYSIIASAFNLTLF